MEYAPNYGFVDESTLFATNRESSLLDISIRRRGKTLTIKTKHLVLKFRDDGKPFHQGNLSVTYCDEIARVEWNPGLKDTKNLGGPAATLDNVSEAFDLPDGILSRAGWHLVDDSGKAILKDGWIRQRPGGISISEFDSPGESLPHPDLDWCLFIYGSDYKGALAGLGLVSGRAPLPRRHAMGSWYCRWHPYTDEDFRGIIREYDAHEFPIDVLVMDMDWHTQDAKTGYGHAKNLGWTGYTWNRKLIPEPRKLLSDLKKDSIYVALNDHPADGIREHEDCYPEFQKLLGQNASTNPPFIAGDQSYMEAFFAAAHSRLENDGVDFWWLDWQQNYIYPTVIGVPGLRHLPWLNALYYQHTRKNGRRGLGLSRWGGLGDHRHPIHFSGDAKACWAMLKFEVSFTIASGNAGCFYWAHDIGGFYGERNAEMYTRWVQFGALSAALRLHSCGEDLDRRPWLWGQRFESAMRRAFVLRSELFPYLYSASRQCYDHMLPLLRGMYFEYPDQEEAYQFSGQYMLGDHILVAPISRAGKGEDLAVRQKIWFPEGEWFHFFTGERITGNRIRQLSFGIDEIPIYVKGGSPVPLQPYAKRMASVSLDTLRIRCYPGSSGVSILYEDDGQTEGYVRNECAFTRVDYREEGITASIKINQCEGRFKGQKRRRAYQIELVGFKVATNATVNGKAFSLVYDASLHAHIVSIPSSPIDRALECIVQIR